MEPGRVGVASKAGRKMTFQCNSALSFPLDMLETSICLCVREVFFRPFALVLFEHEVDGGHSVAKLLNLIYLLLPKLLNLATRFVCYFKVFR